MKSIAVTLEVSNFVTSRLVSEEQPLNTPSIAVTLEVLKFVTSRLVSEEQPQNILRILVTLDVSRSSSPSIVVSSLKRFPEYAPFENTHTDLSFA